MEKDLTVPKGYPLEGKKLVKLISSEQIKNKVLEISNFISKNYQNKKPIIICVLNGAVYFTMDLIKYFDFNYKIDFIKIKSYVDMNRGKYHLKNLILKK